MVKAIDLFAGFGGFSIGATAAGANVVWAANHWKLAVDTHQMNHPATEHVCQDLRQADWSQVPTYDLLLAAPACQGHSTASQPRRRRYHDALRATAWAVIDCADATEPKAIIIENVPAFTKWRLYPIWKESLVRLGYFVTENRLMASRFGVPQRRDRIFIVASKRNPLQLVQSDRDEPAFGPHVDWYHGNWRHLSAAAPGARRRMEVARERLGQRCIVQHVTGHRGISASEPIRTITGADQWVVVKGNLYRPLTLRENLRAMGFPDTYRWPARAGRRDVIRGLGNAVCPPVATAITAQVMEAI